jgi:hypothetical protein
VGRFDFRLPGKHLADRFHKTEKALGGMLPPLGRHVLKQGAPQPEGDFNLNALASAAAIAQVAGLLSSEPLMDVDDKATCFKDFQSAFPHAEATSSDKDDLPLVVAPMDGHHQPGLPGDPRRAGFVEVSARDVEDPVAAGFMALERVVAVVVSCNGPGNLGGAWLNFASMGSHHRDSGSPGPHANQEIRSLALTFLQSLEILVTVFAVKQAVISVAGGSV